MMKKTTLIFLFAPLFAFQVAGQQVVPVQASLITKRTATWCPNCGNWGWTLFDDLLEANQGKAVFFAAHFSGDLANTTATELTTNFGAAYQPVFYFNETNQEALSSNTASVLASVGQKVDAAYSSTPVANVGFDSTYAGGTLTVNAKVKFFQPASGEFYLGMYLVEDNVIANQASIGPNANHKKVLRASFSSSTWGELIGSGNFATGEEFSKTFSLAVDNPATHSYQLAGIIWKKEGGKYLVVNAWATGIQGSASAAGESTAVQTFSVAPNVTETGANVFLNLSANLAGARLELCDASGAVVKKVFAGNLPTGSHQFELNREGWAPGLYFLRLEGEGHRRIEKVVFQ